MMKKVFMLAALLCCTLSGFAEEKPIKIEVRKDVTDKKAPGNVVINSGTINMVGNRVELQAGTKVSKGLPP